MHSISAIRSAGGAAGYFTKDDYYTGEGTAEFSAWGGKGAEALGLSGKVEKQPFEDILNGRLPDGTEVNQVENRRVGLDLTFSMPKSASILALVGGDTRLLEAHRQAVMETMVWVEKNLAEVRDYSRGPNGEAVRTGNLVYAMFEHDTSRKLDPQSHIHVVVVALSLARNGEWRALFNGAIWKANSIIGSAYHAAFREKVEALGYETEVNGKHGQFEIHGIPEKVTTANSQRRTEILEKVDELGITTPQGQDKVVVGTRDNKIDVEDKAALRQEWEERCRALGFDAKGFVAAAVERADSEAQRGGAVAERSPMLSMQSADTVFTGIFGAITALLRPNDPLTTNGLQRLKLTPTEMRTQVAVASAIRILGQREAAFERSQLAKTALDLGLKNVTMERVETRIRQLAREGQLIPGKSDRLDKLVTHVTTPEHLALERHLLADIDAGRDKGVAALPASEARQALATMDPARLVKPEILNEEQLSAATLALASRDRTVIVQGVAGAGKSTMIDTMARVAEDQGRQVLGLAFANKMVNQLRDDAAISAQTVSSFVNKHLKAALRGEGKRFEASKALLAGKVLVLDEASLVANEAMRNLTFIANAFAVEKMVMIGDRHQLLPIDAGKAFLLVQSHEPTIAHMPTSLRQTTKHMQAVARLSRQGKVKQAFEVLDKQGAIHVEGKDYLAAAARTWLDLSPTDRENTGLYTSGRLSRAWLNEAVQKGLREEGTLTGEQIRLTTMVTVNTTREEMRYPGTYKPGQILDVTRHQALSGVPRGRYDVTRIDKRGNVHLRGEDGRMRRFQPTRISPVDKRDALKLSQREPVTLQAGDRIRWTGSDKERGIINSDPARVIGVSAAGVEVELANMQNLLLAAGDKMLERLGLGYAINMHQAQGMTTQKAIGVMHSSERNLANARLFHVMATRVREDFALFTNDAKQLLRSIGGNPGNKTSSLETIGEKRIEGSTARNATLPRQNKPAMGRGNQLQAPPAPTLAPASLRAEPDKHVGPQLPVPEKSMERSL